MDVGCGTGYGSKILSESGCLVTGIDIEQEAINIARKTYPEIDFRNVDAARFSCTQKDHAVAFEILEHLENPSSLVERLYEIIAPGGLFIGSVPNLEKYPFDPEDWKDHKYPHHRHYRANDLFELFRPFKIVGIWGQEGEKTRIGKQIDWRVRSTCHGLFHVVVAYR